MVLLVTQEIPYGSRSAAPADPACMPSPGISAANFSGQMPARPLIAERPDCSSCTWSAVSAAPVRHRLKILNGQCEESGTDAGCDEDCEVCGGTGSYTPEEPTEDQVSEWQQNLSSELAIVGEPPV